jgi:hypothetical protein
MTPELGPPCCLCGEPCEPWHAPWHAEPGGYGHNPDPLGEEGERCCNTCNDTKVIPARIGLYFAVDQEIRDQEPKP